MRIRPTLKRPNFRDHQPQHVDIRCNIGRRPFVIANLIKTLAPLRTALAIREIAIERVHYHISIRKQLPHFQHQFDRPPPFEPVKLNCGQRLSCYGELRTREDFFEIAFDDGIRSSAIRHFIDDLGCILKDGRYIHQDAVVFGSGSCPFTISIIFCLRPRNVDGDTDGTNGSNRLNPRRPVRALVRWPANKCCSHNASAERRHEQHPAFGLYHA
ncbi:hypothetical protein BCO18175_02698 [Burkholderia contaminans]|nr:hypothetical protein BCO18175_02698 [Burkholderia contaminans]